MCVVIVGTVNTVIAGALVCVLTEEDALEAEVLCGRESVAGCLGLITAVPREGRGGATERGDAAGVAEGAGAAAGERRVKHVGRKRAKLCGERDTGSERGQSCQGTNS